MEVIRQASAVMSLTITDMQIYSEGKIEDLRCIGIKYLTLFDFGNPVTVTNNCHSEKKSWFISRPEIRRVGENIFATTN
jgi:hypothetical protein